MVIPIQGGVQLRGPVPEELSSQFVKLKWCTLVMMGSYVIRIIYNILCLLKVIQAAGDIWIDMNLLLNIMIAIWLMKDDPTIKKAYDFLTTHCCQACGQQCPGSMSCLMLFGIINFITVVMAVIRNLEPQSEVGLWWITLQGIGSYLDTSKFKFDQQLTVLLFLIYTTAYITLHVAMAIGTVYSYQAYKIALELGLAQDPMLATGPMGGGGPFGGGDWGRPSDMERGGGRMGGGNMPPPGYQNLPSAPPAPPNSRAPQQQRFVPFSGQGHSLGSR